MDPRPTVVGGGSIFVTENGPVGTFVAVEPVDVEFEPEASRWFGIV